MEDEKVDTTSQERSPLPFSICHRAAHTRRKIHTAKTHLIQCFSYTIYTLERHVCYPHNLKRLLPVPLCSLVSQIRSELVQTATARGEQTGTAETQPHPASRGVITFLGYANIRVVF